MDVLYVFDSLKRTDSELFVQELDYTGCAMLVLFTKMNCPKNPKFVRELEVTL